MLARTASCLLVCTSRWGVVLVEAAAAGLPIICTDACGARHEVVRGNGIVVKAGDVVAFADAMETVDGMISRVEHVERVERESAGEWVSGELGRELAKPYSCEAWAERVLGICKKLTGGV